MHYEISVKPESNSREAFVFEVDGQIIRTLETVSLLGEGGIGAVFLVKDLATNDHLALKIINKNVSSLAPYISAGLSLIRQVANEYPIAKIYESYHYIGKFEQVMYIVLVCYQFNTNSKHYYEHGGLDKYLKKMGQVGTPIAEPIIKKIAEQLLTAVHCLHSTRPRPIIHRDISLDNLLIKQINEDETIDIVLNDFDTARDIGENSNLTASVGKRKYYAPEVASGRYNTSVDIWSCGISLYELMTLSRTTISDTMGDVTEQEEMHVVMRMSLGSKRTYSKQLIELVLSMIKFNPRDRPSAIELLDKLAGKEKLETKPPTDTISSPVEETPQEARSTTVPLSNTIQCNVTSLNVSNIKIANTKISNSPTYAKPIKKRYDSDEDDWGPSSFKKKTKPRRDSDIEYELKTLKKTTKIPTPQQKQVSDEWGPTSFTKTDGDEKCVVS